MKTLLKLPEAADQVINEYSKLPLGGKEIVCPYHINNRKERVGLRALVGKGDPGEIVKEVKVWAKLKDFDLYKANADQIREFMVDRSIGIDCSGFVVHLLGYILKTKRKKRLWQYIKFPDKSLLGRIRRVFRPIENLGANTLTNLDNCIEIKDINKILPGDLIRSKGLVKNSHHIIIIYSVLKNGDKVEEIDYVHSRMHYGNNNGIAFGKIKIVDPKLPLEKQKWDEVQDGKNWTLDGYLKDLPDNGIRRLKAFKVDYVSQEVK